MGSLSDCLPFPKKKKKIARKKKKKKKKKKKTNLGRKKNRGEF